MDGARAREFHVEQAREKGVYSLLGQPPSGERFTEARSIVALMAPTSKLSRRVCVVALAAAAAAAAVIACIVAGAAPGVRGDRSAESRTFKRFRSDLLEGKAQMAPKCGHLDHDTDYVVESDEGYNVMHIPSVDMCCALCWGDSNCKAWIYINATSDAPSGCWIKFSEPSHKAKKVGATSGLAPSRVNFDDVARPPIYTNEGPTLFCFSLAMPSGYEMELLRWQQQRRVSIFACHETSVFTNRSMEIAGGVKTSLVDSDLHSDIGGYYMTALNSWIFIAVWKAVLDEGKYLRNDWTVKVDPDAVFLPDRLQPILASHAGAPYINNCKFGLHGPIEVLSRHVLGDLAADYNASWDGKAPKRCVKEQDFGLYGEDMFLHVCLDKILKVGEAPLEGRLMCEAHCECKDWYWCTSGPDTVSFHPFKTVDAYNSCMAAAMLTLPDSQSMGYYVDPGKYSKTQGATNGSGAPQQTAAMLKTAAPAPQQTTQEVQIGEEVSTSEPALQAHYASVQEQGASGAEEQAVSRAEEQAASRAEEQAASRAEEMAASRAEAMFQRGMPPQGQNFTQGPAVLAG